MLKDSLYHKTELSRFFRYCSNQQINPTDVTDAVSASYLQALETEALVSKPRIRHQSVCRVWNKCAELHQQKGWPDIALAVPRYEGRLYSIDETLLSNGIKQDLDDYITFLAGDDPFSAHARPFRPKSLEAVKGYFWRYLSALHYQGINLKTINSLSDLVTKNMFTLGIRWFWERNQNETSKNIGEIVWTVRCYAVKHIGTDEATTAFYNDALACLLYTSPSPRDLSTSRMPSSA